MAIKLSEKQKRLYWFIILNLSKSIDLNTCSWKDFQNFVNEYLPKAREENMRTKRIAYGYANQYHEQNLEWHKKYCNANWEEKRKMCPTML